ncbi:MAG: class I SAM-dependent methyltransferase [Candidatus Dormibacteraeota bacterium]|nr:class I SAM-dependent methyltransferase [Candidatus Dormibacteraeota bacterium]
MAPSREIVDWLLAHQETPPLFAPGTHPLWTDPHIAHGMLRAHLDPTRDAASRRPEKIARTVDWIGRLLEKGARILDLGCGPGLYAGRLAAAGFDVTGIDWSEVSIRHARSQPSAARYLLGDYRRIDLDERFNAVLMIYLELGTFPPSDVRLILRRVHTWLLPGGLFVFDVATPTGRAGSERKRDWGVAETGFWSPAPHLWLTRTVRYGDGPVYLDEHVVVTAGEQRVYRVWERCYEPSTVEAELTGAGFGVESVHADLAGAPYGPGSSPALGVIARRH